jgi:hypothetical protein
LQSPSPTLLQLPLLLQRKDQNTNTQLYKAKYLRK